MTKQNFSFRSPDQFQHILYLAFALSLSILIAITVAALEVIHCLRPLKCAGPATEAPTPPLTITTFNER